MPILDASGAPLPADDSTVKFFEHCLAAARAGRVLFVVASVGLVGEPVAVPRPQRPLVLLEDRPERLPPPKSMEEARERERRAAGLDTAPTPRKFEVLVGTALGHRLAEPLHHATLVSCFADVVKGAQQAQAAIATELVRRAPAGGEGRSS